MTDERQASHGAARTRRADDGKGRGRVEPLQVIAAPQRLRILELVWDRELSAGQIASQFEVSWSAVSQHLRVLKTAGFVTERRGGNSGIYRACQAAPGVIFACSEDPTRSRLGRLK